MLVTVAICTRNRAESLRRTLESLTALQLPPAIEWEIVIINNASTDHTGKVIGGYAELLPIRHAFEPQIGLSLARNRAVGTAAGEYVIWVDDDVVVGPAWLSAYVEAFLRWPEASVFGGPIIPRYVTPVPKWLADSEPFLGAWIFARRDVDCMSEISLDDRLVPLGPNFALRAAEQ